MEQSNSRAQFSVNFTENIINDEQEAQHLHRNSTSAAHICLVWLTDRAMHKTLQNRRYCTTRL